MKITVAFDSEPTRQMLMIKYPTLRQMILRLFEVLVPHTGYLWPQSRRTLGFRKHKGRVTGKRMGSHEHLNTQVIFHFHFILTNLPCRRISAVS